MSDREKETIQQVILPDFGPSSLPKPPAPSSPDPSSLVDQVSDRVTFGAGARTGSIPTPNRPPASARDPLRSKQNLPDTETVEDQDSPLSTLNFPTVADLEKCLSPINKQPSKSHIYRILLAIVIVVIVIVASLIAFNRAWHSRHETPKALNVPQKTTPALPPEPVGKPLQLPSFVPTASLDAAYTRANPGWERYLTADTEFRVFREGSAIRALQAIDLTGKGIPEVFANKALAEVADLTEQFPALLSEKEVTLSNALNQAPLLGRYYTERTQAAKSRRLWFILTEMTSIRRILPFLAILLTLATPPLAATNFELDIRELDRQPASSSAPKHPTSAKQPKKAIKPEPPVKAPSAKSSSRQETTKPKQKPERSVISVHGATQCERAASLLGQLGIMFSKGEEIPVGREGSGLSFKTDLLFSADGRRHAVICTRQDEGGYTLIRIAEMQGLHIIRLETDRFLLMGDKILSALGLQYTTTTEQVKTRKGKRTATGFLVTSKGKEIFVAGE